MGGISKKRGETRSRFTTDTRSPSSGFLPKPSPREMPKTRMNRNGMTRRMTRARGSRANRRRSFLAKVQTGMQVSVFPTECHPRARIGSVAEGAAGQLQKHALQIRLFDFEIRQLDILFVQERDEFQKRRLRILAFQLERLV